MSTATQARASAVTEPAGTRYQLSSHTPRSASRWVPVRIYEELSGERYELRKIEEFADGRLIRSDRINPDSATSLSWQPVPTEEEIAAQDEFTVKPLTAEAFNSAWARASDAR